MPKSICFPPEKPVVIRMDGKCEEFKIGISSLAKKGRESDIIVELLPNGSIAITSRIVKDKDPSGKQLNVCSLTISQLQQLIVYLNQIFGIKEQLQLPLFLEIPRPFEVSDGVI